MTTIQLRIDENTKNLAKATLDELGIDMSTAIKMYLKQIIIRKGIPLELLTANGLTAGQEKTILKSSKEGQDNVNTTNSMDVDEMKDYLNDVDAG